MDKPNQLAPGPMVNYVLETNWHAVGPQVQHVLGINRCAAGI